MSYFDFTATMIPFGWAGKPENVGGREWFPVSVMQHPFEWWAEKFKFYCGEDGDGIRFTICVGEDSIVETGIPEESLGTLIEALTAIKKLRKSEKP